MRLPKNGIFEEVKNGDGGGYSNIYVDNNPNDKYKRLLTMRKYELKDHLGNVRVVVGDIKQAQNFDNQKPFLAEVHGVNTYYPFGSLQPGRYYQSGGYRFGFNGMLMDNEVTETAARGGTGNTYSTKFRAYNPRFGRWFSIDPLFQKIAWLSPYVGVSNNPILMIDREGDWPWTINHHVRMGWGKFKSYEYEFSRLGKTFIEIDKDDRIEFQKEIARLGINLRDKAPVLFEYIKNDKTEIGVVSISESASPTHAFYQPDTEMIGFPQNTYNHIMGVNELEDSWSNEGAVAHEYTHKYLFEKYGAEVGKNELYTYSVQVALNFGNDKEKIRKSLSHPYSSDIYDIINSGIFHHFLNESVSGNEDELYYYDYEGKEFLHVDKTLEFMEIIGNKIINEGKIE